MENAKSNGYNLQSLLPLNVSYDYEYRLNEADVQNVNMLMEEFAKERVTNVPKPGDVVMYTSKHGDYLPDCLVECYDDYGLKVITKPCISHVQKTEHGIKCTPNSGPITHLPAEKLKYVGKTNSLFKINGYQNECRAGFVHFYGNVNVWEYIEPDPLYENFTTKEWRKIYLRKNAEKEFLYSGKGIRFRDQESFDKFLKAYKGKAFPGNFSDQIVVWCYRDILKKVPVAEWEQIKATVMNRRVGSETLSVKVVCDSVNHQFVTIIPIQEKSSQNQ